MQKCADKYRDYSVDPNDPIRERVRRTYLDMHTYQTVDFVKSMHKKWFKFDHFKSTIMEALDMLNSLIDESDPDIDLPNVVHAYQTAERIRKDHPDKEWFQLVGLIHDLGKVMAFYNEPQWAVVGDTFPVGCRPQKSIVYWATSFHNNPDLKNDKYNSTYGIYEPNCGLDNVLMSWGHDEYLYGVLKHNKAEIPEEGLFAIRFHSFYPWHSGGDYEHLSCDKDQKMLTWVKELNKFDLYTKSDKIPNIMALKPYYQSLIDKFVPGVLSF